MIAWLAYQPESGGKKTQSKTDIGSCDFFPQIWGSEGEGITQATGVW